MKYTQIARLGGSTSNFYKVTAEEFMIDYAESSRANYRGRIYCCYCSQRMSFVIREKTPFFRHLKGLNECKKNVHISPDKKRARKRISKIIDKESTLGITGHKQKLKKRTSTPEKHIRDDDKCPLGEPQNKNNPSKPRYYRTNHTDLSIEEIIEQIILGKDLSKKRFIFYGKSRSFNEVFIDFHKISRKAQSHLNDGEFHIYWGSFNRICCKKENKNCDLCRLDKDFIKSHPIIIYCGRSNKPNEPIIQFTTKCSSKLISKHRDLASKNPDGFLVVVSEEFKPGFHPKIMLNKINNYVFYLSKALAGET